MGSRRRGDVIKHNDNTGYFINNRCLFLNAHFYGRTNTWN